MAAAISEHKFGLSPYSNAGTIILPISQFNLDRRVNSVQSPYTIVDVAHIVFDPLRPDIKGRLTISIAPGKKDQRWNRDLQLDLDAIKNNGIQVIVCLLQWSEMKMLSITDYPKRAQEQGFLFYHLPIQDRRTPNHKDIDVLVPIIVQHLIAGQNVLVHCRGGLGRAGTICGCCLGHFGYDGVTAIGIVRKQRPGAIQTEQQAACVVKYCREVTNRIITPSNLDIEQNSMSLSDLSGPT